MKNLKSALFFCFSTQIYVVYAEWSSPGFPNIFCPRATWGNTEHAEGRTSYVMWLFRGMLYSTESTNFRKFITFHQVQISSRASGDPDLANKLRILLLVTDFTNRDELVFSWPAWANYGFELATKGLIQSHMASDVTRLDGARSKKQVWRPHVRNWGRGEENMLHWRKHLWHFWTFRRPPYWFGAPMATRRLGNCASLVTPLHMAISHCCQARNQGGQRRRNPLKFWTANIEPLSKIVMTAYSRLIIPPSCG